MPCAADNEQELDGGAGRGLAWPLGHEPDRLGANEGRGRGSRELLAPVYGWFTEGFDTLDLKEAKGLLEELAA